MTGPTPPATPVTAHTANPLWGAFASLASIFIPVIFALILLFAVFIVIRVMTRRRTGEGKVHAIILLPGGRGVRINVSNSVGPVRVATRGGRQVVFMPQQGHEIYMDDGSILYIGFGVPLVSATESKLMASTSAPPTAIIDSGLASMVAYQSKTARVEARAPIDDIVDRLWHEYGGEAKTEFHEPITGVTFSVSLDLKALEASLLSMFMSSVDRLMNVAFMLTDMNTSFTKWLNNILRTTAQKYGFWIMLPIIIAIALIILLSAIHI
jgi:uncharacterized membrane protein